MKSKYIIIAIIVLSQGINSCDKEYSTSELRSNFSNKEISDLEKITSFFKKSICPNMSSDFKTCYNQLYRNSLEQNNIEPWMIIDFEKQKKLYKEISPSTYDEIWMYCESTYFPSDTKTQDICPVYNGRYQNYLTDLGEKNPKIAEYVTRIEESGIFSDFYITYPEVLKNDKSFDLNDPNIQLILAVHYLSLNDSAKRNVHLFDKQELKLNVFKGFN